jgi:hypothetical protein
VVPMRRRASKRIGSLIPLSWVSLTEDPFHLIS